MSRLRSAVLALILMALMGIIGVVGYAVMWAIAHFGGPVGVWAAIAAMLAAIAYVFYREMRGFGRGH